MKRHLIIIILLLILLDPISVKTLGSDSPIVALTFDDGPNAIYTPLLLDGLKERNIKVTFFLTGENITGNESLVQRMKEDGHLIGNHTFSHISLERVSEQTAQFEVEKTSNLIFKITGDYPMYLRPPYGSWKKDLEFSVTMIPVFWTLDTLDWKSQDEACILQTVKESVKDQDIILMHDEYETSVSAALAIVDMLTEQGYSFVTVDQLVDIG